MRITISHNEYDRRGNRYEVTDGSFNVNSSVEAALSVAAREYRTNKAGMLGIILAYYFGDGSNHLGCSDCGFWCQDDSQGEKGGCTLPCEVKQTTLPLLDKGSVVVGKPVNELGV